MDAAHKIIIAIVAGVFALGIALGMVPASQWKIPVLLWVLTCSAIVFIILRVAVGVWKKVGICVICVVIFFLAIYIQTWNWVFSSSAREGSKTTSTADAVGQAASNAASKATDAAEGVKESVEGFLDARLPKMLTERKPRGFNLTDRVRAIKTPTPITPIATPESSVTATTSPTDTPTP